MCKRSCLGTAAHSLLSHRWHVWKSLPCLGAVSDPCHHAGDSRAFAVRQLSPRFFALGWLWPACSLYSKQGRETGFVLLFTAPNGASEQTLGIFLRNGPHKNLPSLPWSLLKSHYPYFICHGIDVTVSSPVWEFSLPMWFRPRFSLLWGLRDGDPVFAAVLEGTSCRCATLTVTLLGSIPGTLFLRKPLMGKTPYCFRTSWFTGSRQDMCVLWVAYDHPFGWKEVPCHPLCLSMQQKLLYLWLQSDGRWRSEH